MLLYEVTDLRIGIPDGKIRDKDAGVSGRLDWASPLDTVHGVLVFMILIQGDAGGLPA